MARTAGRLSSGSRRRGWSWGWGWDWSRSLVRALVLDRVQCDAHSKTARSACRLVRIVLLPRSIPLATRSMPAPSLGPPVDRSSSHRIRAMSHPCEGSAHPARNCRGLSWSLRFRSAFRPGQGTRHIRVRGAPANRDVWINGAGEGLDGSAACRRTLGTAGRAAKTRLAAQLVSIGHHVRMNAFCPVISHAFGYPE